MAKDFNTIQAELLQDHKGVDTSVDVSQGSIVFINSAAVASALWGLYCYMDYVLRQVFPDTAESAMLERHAWSRAGMTRKAGESDDELLDRLLTYMQQPPAGGNRADYVAWAREVEGVAAAKCISCPQGAGTVDVVILANSSTGSETPTQTLIDAVYAHIDSVRPVTASTFRVVAAQIVTQDISMTASGDINKSTLAATIRTLISALGIGKALCVSTLPHAAHEQGATDASVQTPESNVLISDYQVLRPGTVTVN